MRRSFKTNLDIRYRDTDSMGHVSSPVYYEYMQTAYLEYMHTILEIPKSDKLPHIMVKTQCEYLAPAQFGDNLTIRSSIVRFGSKSFDLEHLMERDDQTIVARGMSTHVMFDYANNTTQAVPDEFKARVLEFQGSL